MFLLIINKYKKKLDILALNLNIVIEKYLYINNWLYIS